MDVTRRLILKLSFAVGLMLALFPWLKGRWNLAGNCAEGSRAPEPSPGGFPLGTDGEGLSQIYVARNGTPEENVRRVVEMMGGIEKLIDPDDIVVLKPNSQWWNQGMTDTDAMKGFVELVLARPGFEGEIIIADNHQYQEDNSRGWTTDSPSGTYNLNGLVGHFQERGFRNVTKCHWHCAGPNRGLVQGDAHGDSVVEGPWEGDGYVWRRDMIYRASSGRRTMITYPVFTSSYSGIKIDFKDGPYKDGEYLGRGLKFINFPALNHHSFWGGVTCCIKNYLGVVDMSCGYHGDTPEGLFNFHYVGHSNLNENYPLLERIKARLGIGYIDHFNAGPVGYFMRNVRMADLNIVTAERVGFGSRTDPARSARAGAIVAGTDPVALDYYASKHILLPVTPDDSGGRGLSYHRANDPDNRAGPLRWYLEECHGEGIGNLSEDRMKVQEIDYASG